MMALNEMPNAKIPSDIPYLPTKLTEKRLKVFVK